MKGLRREELALLAGVSVEYYTRLERGNAHGVSDSVLEALVRALQLDEAERAHLYDLARTTDATARIRRRPPQQRVRPGIQRLLDAMTGVPAFVQNGRLDVLAANPLARALYADLLTTPDPAGVPEGHPTTPGSPSSIRGPPTSTPTGTVPPPTAWRCCGPRSAAAPATGN